MQKWEYLTEIAEVDLVPKDLLADFGGEPDHEPLFRYLARMGDNGWELVSLEPVGFAPGKLIQFSVGQTGGRSLNFLFVFKRPGIQ